MTKSSHNTKKTKTGTNVEHVKKQNNQQNQQFGTEFGSETDVQEVKKQNKQSQQNKQ